MPDLPQPPDHLSADAAAWWREVLRDYSLEPHHVRLLQLACEAWDRARQAQAELTAHGALTFRDEDGNLYVNGRKFSSEPTPSSIAADRNRRHIATLNRAEQLQLERLKKGKKAKGRRG